MNVCVLFSGGKDSTFSLHWAVLKGFRVECLVTIEPKSEESWMFHYPGIRLTKLQSKALRMPQIYLESSAGKVEEIEDLKKALLNAREEFSIDGVVCGVMLSDYQRMNVCMVAEDLGLKTYCPLWRKNQEEYFKEIVEWGFEVMITGIYVYGLSEEFLGRVVSKSDVLKIIELAEKHGFNPAFEGGEAETIVLDAPLFKEKLIVKSGRKVKLSEHSWRYVIEEVELMQK